MNKNKIENVFDEIINIVNNKINTKSNTLLLLGNIILHLFKNNYDFDIYDGSICKLYQSSHTDDIIIDIICIGHKLIKYSEIFKNDNK